MSKVFVSAFILLTLAANLSMTAYASEVESTSGQPNSGEFVVSLVPVDIKDILKATSVDEVEQILFPSGLNLPTNYSDILQVYPASGEFYCSEGVYNYLTVNYPTGGGYTFAEVQSCEVYLGLCRLVTSAENSDSFNENVNVDAARAVIGVTSSHLTDVGSYQNFLRENSADIKEFTYESRPEDYIEHYGPSTDTGYGKSLGVLFPYSSVVQHDYGSNNYTSWLNKFVSDFDIRMAGIGVTLDGYSVDVQEGQPESQQTSDIQEDAHSDEQPGVLDEKAELALRGDIFSGPTDDGIGKSSSWFDMSAGTEKPQKKDDVKIDNEVVETVDGIDGGGISIEMIAIRAAIVVLVVAVIVYSIKRVSSFFER